MQKIIGLDIGSYSVKAVEIVNSINNYEITNFYENIIPHIDELSPDVILPACMEQLFRENDIDADRIVTAMPGQYISSRILSFNFSDHRKIEQSILPMVEDVVPFNLDDMIVDHQILGEMGDQTAALVVMTRKNFLQTFLEHLQRIDIDPKLVDIDSLAFYNLNPYLKMEPGKCYGLVDVGHEKTSVCIVQDGVLRMFRSINLGGRYITDFLARDLEASFNEAQRIKHRVSRVFGGDDKGEDLDANDRLIVERMTLASNAIVKELGRTFYAFKTWEKSPIYGVFLSGGTSCIKNFDRYLADHLEVNVEYNRIDESELKINPELSDKIHRMAQGVAIGMRAASSVKRHSQINLRKGEFAYVQDYESILKGATIAFRAVAFVMLVLMFLYGIQYWSYDKHISALKDQYKKDLVVALPDLKKKYKKKDYKLSVMKKDAKGGLQGNAADKLLAVEDFLTLNSESGSLVLLKTLSKAIPKELKVDIIRYQFNSTPGAEGKMVLKGETDTFDSSTAVLEKLKTLKDLTKVIEKSSGYKPGSDKKIVEFVIHANYSAAVSGDEVL